MSIEKLKSNKPSKPGKTSAVKVSGIIDRISVYPVPVFTLLGDASGFMYTGYVQGIDQITKLSLTKPGDEVSFILDSYSDIKEFENKSLAGYVCAKEQDLAPYAAESLGL